MDREVVYLGHDNSINFILKEAGVAVSLQGITQMTFTLPKSGITITSDNGDADPIRWNKAQYATGEIRIFLGNEIGVDPGIEDGVLVVYDATNPNGVVWGKIPVHIEDEIEIASP